MYLLALVAVGVVIWWLAKRGAQAELDSRAKQLAALPGFKPQVSFVGLREAPGIAIDPIGKKLALTTSKKSKAIAFSEIVACQLVIETVKVRKRDEAQKGPKAKELPASYYDVEQVVRVALKIFTTDMMEPVHTVPFFLSEGADPDEAEVRSSIGQMEKWQARLMAIIREGSGTS